MIQVSAAKLSRILQIPMKFVLFAAKSGLVGNSGIGACNVVNGHIPYARDGIRLMTMYVIYVSDLYPKH